MKRINSRNPRTGKVIKGKRFKIKFYPNIYTIHVQSLGDVPLIQTSKEYLESQYSKMSTWPRLFRDLMEIHGIKNVSFTRKKNEIGIWRFGLEYDWSFIIPDVLTRLSRAIPRNSDEHDGGYGLVLRAKSCQPSHAFLDSISRVGTVYAMNVIL